MLVGSSWPRCFLSKGITGDGDDRQMRQQSALILAYQPNYVLTFVYFSSPFVQSRCFMLRHDGKKRMFVYKQSADASDPPNGRKNQQCRQCAPSTLISAGRTSICCATLRTPLRPKRSSRALLSSTGRAAQAVRSKRHHHQNPPEPPRGCPDTPEDNHVTRVARRGRTAHFSSKFMSEHGNGYPENHHRYPRCRVRGKHSRHAWPG
jgi:hypothetical protein